MEPTREVEPYEISYELITQAQIREIRFKRFGFTAWRGTITRGRMFALAALLILVLPVGMALSYRQDFPFTVPFLDRIFSPPSSNQSAVLAVDVHQLTIRGKNISAVARERLEQAAVEQLAQLHPIYAGWAATDEEALGSMLLKLHVDGTGKVARIEPLRSRLSSADFSRVVFEEIGQWNFPVGPGQPIEIIVPLLFVPKGLDADTVVQWERRTRDKQAEQKLTNPAHGSPTATASRAMMPAAGPTGSGASPVGGVQLHTPNLIKPTGVQTSLPVVKTTRAVALRQQPRFAAERVHEIDADTELSLLEKKGNWLKVRIAEAAVIGFVRKEYLTPVN